MIKKRLNFVTRFLPGLFTGLLLFSGCSQDDVSGVPVGSRAIGFRAQGGMSSLKATTTSKEYIQSFVVNAHYGDDWTPETGKYLLRGTTVYRGEDDNWAYSPQAYFPTTDEGAVGFFAYSPSGSKNVETGLKDAATANQTITCKVPSPTGPATTQEDLLVACTGVLQVNNAYPGTVSLQFRHALSRILVKAVSTLDKEVSVTVTGLTLRNLHSKGTLNLKDVPDAGAPGWAYSQTVTDADDPDDVYVKWDAPAVLSNYSYSLPESGVSVSDAPKYVTGADQGIFILPQTTVVPGSSSPKENVVDGKEFGLAIEYSINGIAAADSAYVQFGDLNGISTAGVTFENGRQYVLNLTFGAGSGSGGTDPDINIGAKISFEDIDAENYGKDIKVPVDYRASGARSNIYYNEMADEIPGNNEGALTFETDGSKEGYQGVFFKWGSLIGIDAGTSGSFASSTYLFIPDLSTGKYRKVAVSDATTINSLLSITGWSGSGGSADWGLIPYAATSVIPALTPASRADARLTDRSTDADLYKNYRGDICKFLSDKKSTNLSSLTGSWRMPVSENFGPDNSYYTRSADWPGSFTGTADDKIDGKGIMDFAEDKGFYSFTGFILPGSTAPIFPASGFRYAAVNGLLINVGNSGFYWSSSATDGTTASHLYFDSSLLNPSINYNDRSSSYSVRCVKE